MHIARWLLVFVFAFSCTAAAQPVRITSQLSGDLLFQNPIVLQQIGHGDFFDFTGDAMPFDLTISALVDPDKAVFGHASQGYYAYDSDVLVTLAMGGTTSRFSDAGATVWLASDSAGYRMEVSFELDFYIASFTTWMRGPAGSFDGLALAPQAVVQGPGMSSAVEITTSSPHPDLPYSWRTGSPGSAASLTIVSAVPEPANAAMLFVGLLALACAARRSTRSRQSSHTARCLVLR